MISTQPPIFSETIPPIEEYKLPDSEISYSAGQVKLEKAITPNSISDEHSLFDRVYCITFATQEGNGISLYGRPKSTGLDMSFDVEKDDTQKTNKAKLTFYNLSDATIKIIETKDCLCLIEVGYSQDVGLKRIFVGFVSGVTTSKSGADTQVDISLEDGALPVRNTVVSLSYKGGVSREKIIRDLASSMGVGLIIAKDVKFESSVLNNYSYIGGPEKILNDICGGAELKWSMQNGVLQIVKENGNLGYVAFVLNANSGLISIPKRIVKESRQMDKKSDKTKKASKKAQKKAGWKVVCLLNPTLTPNDIIRVESKIITGWFVVESLHHKGDYSGNEWYTEMEVWQIEEDSTNEEQKNDGK